MVRSSLERLNDDDGATAEKGKLGLSLSLHSGKKRETRWEGEMARLGGSYSRGEGEGAIGGFDGGTGYQGRCGRSDRRGPGVRGGEKKGDKGHKKRKNIFKI